MQPYNLSKIFFSQLFLHLYFLNLKIDKCNLTILEFMMTLSIWFHSFNAVLLNFLFIVHTVAMMPSPHMILKVRLAVMIKINGISKFITTYL